jgi:hypothetical protein
MHTGLQFNNATKAMEPAFYIQKLQVDYGQTNILKAELSVGTAEDPYFRFLFQPEAQTSKLVVEIQDNQSHHFKEEVEVSPL